MKNVPPGGPQMNSRPFCSRQTSENVMFCEWGDFGYMRILHSSAIFGSHLADQIFSRFFGTPTGWPKNKEKPGFFGCLMCVFFFFSISSPHRHLSSWHTFLFANVSFILVFLFLLLCFPSLRWLCSLFLFILIFVVFFTFNSGFCLCCLLSWCDKNPDHITTYLKIWLSSSASVPASPHFHLAQIVTLLGQERNPSKCFCLLPCFLVYQQCAEIPIFIVFLHIIQALPTKWAPIKTIMFHKMQNKNRWFWNGLFRKTETFMFTQNTELK